jgi:hypothetical protein
MNIIFKAIVGSQVYGTSTPNSDIDYKSVYCQPIDELIGFGYKEQINVTKDDTVYEVRRFLELLQTGNPTVVEMVWTPEDCILEKHPSFDLIIQNRDKFLTKKCLNSFGRYAASQITKAKGLDKKMNWENSRVDRKTPLDFVYVYEEGKTIPISKYFETTKFKQEWCGLVALDHFRDCYALYYDTDADLGLSEPLGYKGIVMDDSNSVRTSSVPKGIKPYAIIFYNKDGYSMHCRDYKDYTTWLENRNINRYVETKQHGQKLDGKNLGHCRRLLDVAMEIPVLKTINVRRPNADYLLQIKSGKVDLDTIIAEAENDILKLDELYANSGLPDEVDKEFVNDLLLQVRRLENIYTKTYSRIN